jgi:ribosomal protein L22
MSPEDQEEKPKRRLRLRGKDADAAPPEVEPTAEDIEAEEATEVMLEGDDEAEGEPEPEADAVEASEPEPEPDLEPEPEAEAEPAAAEEKPARRRLRRGGGSDAAPKPAPTRRRRSQRDPSLPRPVVRAQAKYVRSSARKARLVCDHIRGKTVDEARAILAHTPRAVARDWSKLLESAVANAEHNHELVGEDLYVKAVHADEGPTIKRFRPRAMGRATRIRKRTSHLTILLTPKD